MRKVILQRGERIFMEDPKTGRVKGLSMPGTMGGGFPAHIFVENAKTSEEEKSLAITIEALQ